MYLGLYDWGKVEQVPSEVRTYVKEILINITHVHAEVRLWEEEEDEEEEEEEEEGRKEG